jgi:hypothetical protein
VGTRCQICRSYTLKNSMFTRRGGDLPEECALASDGP